MTEPREIIKGLWTFPIALPDNPLRCLNCYAVKDPSGGRELLVDTGFYRPECLDDLMHGIEFLHLRPENTDVFLTHLHPDHVGNAAYLERLGFSIVMGALDYDLHSMGPDVRWAENMNLLCAEGLSPDMFNRMRKNDSSVVYTSGMFKARKVYNGDRLQYGDFSFECMLTPGHSPGHMCLYAQESGVLLLGDHVLFDITPNICAWTCMYDSLGTYMESLRRTRNIDVKLALPAHRANETCDLAGRIDTLLAHHERRLDDACRIIAENPGLNAYEIAQHMRWKVHAGNWLEFPPNQQFFAHSETVAHLDRLVREGRIERRSDGVGINRYYVRKEAGKGDQNR